jgi:hypothetical protein
MFGHSRNAANPSNDAVGTAAGKQQPHRATLYGGDVRHPWKSAYGFPMTAARLAANEELVLSCREDEIFDYLAQLNDLLGSPESLNRAHGLLAKLAQVTQQKFERLLQQREQSLSVSEIPTLLAEIEEILAGSTEQTVGDRLVGLLSPDEPTQEILGLGKMLARLRRVMTSLEQVKAQGFKVTVLDRQRQPLRPNLEARRHESITGAEQHEEIPAGFALPVQYHLTLWNYRIARSDGGQSVPWN